MTTKSLVTFFLPSIVFFMLHSAVTSIFLASVAWQILYDNWSKAKPMQAFVGSGVSLNSTSYTHFHMSCTYFVLQLPFLAGQPWLQARGSRSKETRYRYQLSSPEKRNTSRKNVARTSPNKWQSHWAGTSKNRPTTPSLGAKSGT